MNEFGSHHFPLRAVTRPIFWLVQSQMGGDLIQINFKIDVTITCPLLWHLELVVGHIELQCFCGAITIPKFKAPLNVFISCDPLTQYVELESLSKYRAELLDVLLHTHDVAV